MGEPHLMGEKVFLSKMGSHEYSHIYLKNILMHIPGSVYWKDKNGVYLGGNQFQAKLLGFDKPEDFIGKTDHELPWHRIADKLTENDQRVIRTGIPEKLVETPTFSDGTNLTMLTSKSPLYDDEGGIIGVIGVSIDVTDLKKAEERERILLAEAEVLKAKIKEEEKMGKTAMLLAGAIAHEMRTPLMGISAEARWLKKVIPILLESYEIATKLPATTIPPILPIHLQALQEISEIFEKTTRNAFTIIDMLMMNFNENPLETTLEVCSISSCIKEALSSYPLTEEEKKVIHSEASEDFSFKGNGLLIQHVLFNLIKNALYYVKKSRNGAIFIRAEKSKNSNILLFKDTGTGIPEDILPHIFDRFFSRTAHGTGIGLAFCKMVMEGLGGNIVCTSIPGESTEFKLEFPTI